MYVRLAPVIPVLLALAIVTPCPASAAASDTCRQSSTFTETFSGGSNEGGWTFGFGPEFMDDQRGRQKEFLRASGLDTFYPIASTSGTSVFTGDFAARGVTAIGADLATIHYRNLDYTFHSPTLVLTNWMGTPEVLDDDCIVFFQSGLDMPPPNGRTIEWMSYTFAIPSISPTLPEPNNGDPCPGGFCETCVLADDPDPTGHPCWGVWKGTNCPTLDDFDLTWRTVISHVDQVSVQWLSPEWLSAFAVWDIGIDNPSISTCR